MDAVFACDAARDLIRSFEPLRSRCNLQIFDRIKFREGMRIDFVGFDGALLILYEVTATGGIVQNRLVNLIISTGKWNGHCSRNQPPSRVS